MDEDEYKKLPVDERCVHKLWKARVHGYEEVTNLFRQIDDEKSPEFAKYLGLIKKFVTDSNAMGQEKGLEATLAFVENFAHAGKTVGEVMAGIVSKCIAASKTRTRELAQQITLMYVEIEKQDAVYEDLLKGMELKNPKIVAACICAATHGLHDFGSKVITVKPLVKKIGVLFADRDKAVRDEARLLAVEIFRWIGAVLRSQLNNLQPVQLAELEGEFSKIEGQKAVPIRYLRSQQEKQAKLAVDVPDCDGDIEEDNEPEPEQLNPYELADPVEIISKLPKDFFEKVEAKKWQERKECMDLLENLVKAPKLESGDYGDIVRALKKIVQKDSNVVVVALAAKCMTGLANGLKKRFQSYASACIPALLEKFKEKKQNVVLAIRDAIDAVYVTTTVDNVLEDVLEAMLNKNPSVKSETALFLARAFTKTPPAALNKKLLKAFTGGLVKIINEPDQTVRDSAAEALGTLMKLVGDKAIGPFIVELEKDNLKMSRIKEFSEKAVITVKVSGAGGAKKDKAAVKTGGATVVKPAAPTAPPRTKPATRVVKRKPDSANSKSSKKPPSATSAVAHERELTDSDVDETITEYLLSSQSVAGDSGDVSIDTIPTALTNTNWKTRLAAVEQLQHVLSAGGAAPVQAVVKLVCRKPGLKDTNFQVLKGRLDVIKWVAANGMFSGTTADFCVSDITEKLSDTKNGSVAGETLTSIAEATSLSHVSGLVMDFAFTQKNPKVLQESLMWLATAIQEFGFANLNAKLLVENAKKGLGSNNPAVRAASITLFGVLYLFMGPTLHMFLENEKQMIRDQINVEFEKYENEKPPPPIRGLKTSNSSGDLADDGDFDGDSPTEAVVAINPLDLLPRVDISPQINEALIAELANKNWKVRNEALIKVAAIIAEAKLIKPSLGELPEALALRLLDSNTKIAQMALSVCESIAKCMGAPCRQHIRILFPGFLQGLGDSKNWIRAASITCINTYAEQCGYKEFFESEMIGDALKNGSPTLRAELWAWLAEALPKIKSVPKEELLICTPYLYTNLEDRNADVRKNSGDAVLGIMIHVGYESMVKQTEKLKPSSKPVVQAILEKVRPNLPAKPAPKKAGQTEEKAVKTVKSGIAPPKAVAKKPGGTVAKPPSRTKKEEDVDTSPLLATNNLKNQRTIDESKLKVLKWNFTTPREEFVELLRDQMTAANVNRTLIVNMFHTDFKCHIKAIESLADDLQENSESLILNLDLVLKWLTLRFFDTNPSVLLKGLEYLNNVFNMLAENNYHMLENEAASFIPYLVNKVGDPKDSVRNGVRGLFKHMCHIYPVSKLFSTYILDGLKSKNARQRVECLEVMGSIIEDFGMSVCLPTPTACMKEVAKQISDRDNSVRNAALNCIVQAFYIVGERVYKLVGRISDKDLSLLEERIKRASKRPPPVKSAKSGGSLNSTMTNAPSGNEEMHQQQSPLKSSGEECVDDDYMEEEEDNLPAVALPPQVVEEPEEEITGPFRLDPVLLRELDSIKSDYQAPKLLTFDLDFLKEDVVLPSIDEARKTTIKPAVISPPKAYTVLNNLNLHGRPNQTKFSLPTGHELIILNGVSKMGSSDIIVASQALEQIQSVLQSNKSSMVANYEDAFMTAITNQLKNLFPQDPRLNLSIAKMYKNILTVVDSFYANKSLGRNVSLPVLKALLMQFIILLIESNLEHCAGGESYIRVINVLCVKIIERSNHTTTTCALIQLLGDSLRENRNARIIDLVMKCLWRIIKIIPSWSDELDFEEILLTVHCFLAEFPSVWWKSRESDTPLRTIKTVIHAMTKIKGGALMSHLGKVPNTNDSEMEGFILKLLKNLKLDEVKLVPLKTEAPRRSLSKSTQSQLTEIFQKIGSKEETMEGLNLLYDFMQQHPEEDIEPFLKRSSQFFQDYIKKHLREIEKTRKAVLTVSDDEKLPANLNSCGDGIKGPEYYQKRLQNFLKQWDEKVKSFD